MELLVSLFLALIAGLLLMEVADRHGQIVVWLVRASTRLLPFSAPRRARYCEEWAADALASPGRLTAIMRAVGTFHAVATVVVAERSKAPRQRIATRIARFFVATLSLDRPIKLKFVGGIHVTISRPQNEPGAKVRFTNREHECLLWTARGKTAWEVSQILSISEETVLFHLRNVTRKLGVFSKHHACVKAVIQGLIIP